MATRVTLHYSLPAPGTAWVKPAFSLPYSLHSSSPPRFKMSSASVPPLPDNRVVLGCGLVSVDFLAAVAAYPKPDDKIRSTSFKVQGGGNAANASICAARLGLKPRLISKVADDPQGKGILEELEADGVDLSFMVVSEGGNSPFTYVIVDEQTKTRTCIHTPGYPPMIPDELTESNLLAALDGARLVYFDGRLHDTALVVAQEATRRGIPILIDAEGKGEGLDDLLNLSTYAICSAKFPEAWTDAPSLPGALVSMLLKLPKIKFVVVTLGEDGCLMLERSSENGLSEEVYVDDLLETLKHKKDSNMTLPTCISSNEVKLHAKGIGTVGGRLLLGTAEKIPPSELVDTTGAGDAFIGAVLYALCDNMPPEKMLPFAAQVAGIGCRALGARTGLPQCTDPRLASFLL
ncbi:Ribokinase [Handroanthus impetiginosus]|uniref:Ribokinase n=1 Tax=Handroanthus impetiginosus TaxID=429701 RepID=A0A2G9HJM3_9LAMI|nr:Ribokinase [Handroanthus impetiginosus]